MDGTTKVVVSMFATVLLLLIFVAACEDDGPEYYHVPGSSHSSVKTPKPKPGVAPKAPSKGFGSGSKPRR